MVEETISRKEEKLREILKELSSAVVAFSGGVDSSYLLYIAHKVLGNKVVAVTAEGAIYPAFEIEEAKEFCSKYRIPHILIRSKALDNPEFCSNPEERCYFCKVGILELLWEIAKKKGYKHVLDGTNIDDLSDHRPGHKAVKELAVRSPLMEAGLGKIEIRKLSKKEGLESWNRPSLACLASRIPYGSLITDQKLKMIEEAEQLIRNLGFQQFRVRLHDNLARIEISKQEMPHALSLDFADKIAKEFNKLGFTYVTLDLMGYRSGSMNEILQKK